MPPNQDNTSNGKQIEQIIAHNYFVFYSCIESTIPNSGIMSQVYA